MIDLSNPFAPVTQGEGVCLECNLHGGQLLTRVCVACLKCGGHGCDGKHVEES